MNSDECIYINLQAINPSQTDSNSIVASINQITNPIVDDLNNYD